MHSRLGLVLRRLHRSEIGGAMAELAVILPVLILFAIGVMDYGRVFFRGLMVANAARAGAEYGATNGQYQNYTQMQEFAKLDASEISGLKVTSQHVCKCADTPVSCSGSCPGYGDGQVRVYVQVTAVDTVDLLIKYPGLPTKIPISRTATFRSTSQ